MVVFELKFILRVYFMREGVHDAYLVLAGCVGGG